MAKIIYCHPSKTQYEYHIYTDLDFWDARCLLKDLALVKRNFGSEPPGDEYPTQIVGTDLSRSDRREIEKRIRKAIVSPPRHIIVQSILMNGFFTFDPLLYYPARWSQKRMIHFTYYRLPLDQSTLNSPYKTVQMAWREGKIHIERVQRDKKYDPVIEDRQGAKRRLRVPSCF